jgi:hypothetical protein
MTGIQTAHYCPDCGEQCSCDHAVVETVGEEQAVTNCRHDCDGRCSVCQTHGHKPDSQHQTAF